MLFANKQDLPGALDIEARMSRLTRWVLLANAGGIAFGLRLPGLEIPIGAGETHCLACLREPALHDPGASREARRA